MNKLIATACVCLSAFVVSTTAFAYEYRETITIMDTTRIVNHGETASIQVPGRPFIHKLLIQAEGAGRNDAYAEVMVNGDIKGTLYLPGRDPHYVVTVAETSGSIEISMVQGAGRFLSIKAVVSNSDEDTWKPIPDHYKSRIGRISSEIIQITNYLDRFTSFPDYQTHLLPLRRASALALAYAESRGDLSQTARPFYEAVVDVLDSSEDYFQRSLEVPQMQDGVIRLMTLREKLKVLLQ